MFKIKIIPDQETYSQEELSRIVHLVEILNMPTEKETTVLDMVGFINSKILNEYAPKGATEFDANTGEFS